MPPPRFRIRTDSPDLQARLQVPLSVFSEVVVVFVDRLRRPRCVEFRQVGGQALLRLGVGRVTSDVVPFVGVVLVIVEFLGAVLVANVAVAFIADTVVIATVSG